MKLHIKENSTPRFMNARSVPLTIRVKVETEHDRMLATSVIQPVSFSKWVSPIVSVLKRNGQVRICGDFKQTVNLVFPIYKYPFPIIDDLYSKVSVGALFYKTLFQWRFFTGSSGRRVTETNDNKYS